MNKHPSRIEHTNEISGFSEGEGSEIQLEMENRIRNLLWTVSGDYAQEMKPDISLYRRSRPLALYDGIKQGALAKFYDKKYLGLYLLKKLYFGADEQLLTKMAQLCIEEAIGDRICLERPGIRNMQREAILDILDQEYLVIPGTENIPEMLRLMVLRKRLDRLEHKKEAPVLSSMKKYMDLVKEAGNSQDTEALAFAIDRLYNKACEPDFEKEKGSFEQVMAVTMEELSEFDWKDLLDEELYEESLEDYAQQLADQIAGMEDSQVTEEMEEQRQTRHKIKILPPEALEKAHRYVELNFGKTYLKENEEKKINQLMCKGIHGDCSLYFTEGILKNPVMRNYQYEYAVRLKNKNVWLYHDKHRVVKRNVAQLTEMLRKSLILRSENQEILSDRGQILPARLWRIGRSRDAVLFKKEQQGDQTDFVVDVLIDASGSQMNRQGHVALQAYMISKALGNVKIPHRVMSYCTFWDYTILHRLREYDDPDSASENIFNYVTSSNNRDGLAIKAAGYGLLGRREEKKIMIILSDGRPYDVIVNRPNAKNPKPYMGQYAVNDTAGEIRRLRNAGVSVLGVFAGEEKDLATEKKIFGKDFAYIRDITDFSRIVGRYLTKQLELEE